MKKFAFYIDISGELDEELVREINTNNEEEVCEELFVEGNESDAQTSYPRSAWQGIVDTIELDVDSIEEAIQLIHEKYDNE